jgi:hypothetical protein
MRERSHFGVDSRHAPLRLLWPIADLDKSGIARFHVANIKAE